MQLVAIIMPDIYDQIPFSAADFAENPEPRCPCVLLLDTSGSMAGQPINELNNGIVNFKDEISADTMAVKRVELFNMSKVLRNYVSLKQIKML